MWISLRTMAKGRIKCSGFCGFALAGLEFGVTRLGLKQSL